MSDPIPEPSTSPLIRVVHAAMEGVVLLLVLASPWYYAGIEAPAILGIHIGVSLLLGLWALRVVLEKNLPWRNDPVLYCLLGFVALTSLQMVPLPPSILGVVSPNALETWRELIPEQLERLPGEAEARRPAFFPTSLAPEETRRFLFGLMNLLVVYCVTRFYLVSKESFRRLAWCCLLNGVLLSLFGLMQFFSSPRDAIYFTERIDGAGVFSTFICRNHFPDYACFCLGLGAVLLVPNAPKRSRVNSVGFTDLLQQPRLLWLVLAMTAILAGVVFSLSRGGMLSGLVALGCCGAIGLRRGGSFGPILWVLPLAVGLVVWLGVSPVDARFASVTTPSLRNESRLRIWEQAMNLIPAYLPLGTGNGTYATVESMGRFDPASAKWMIDAAHNEYLQAAFEGGVPRLLLTLALVGIIVVSALRALSRLKGRSAAKFVLGCLFGLIALGVHSVVDFGVQIPSVALLATVVLAQMMGWAATAREAKEVSQAPNWAICLAVPLFLFLGAVIAREGWNYGLAYESLRESRALERDRKTDHLTRRIEMLRFAVEHQPRDGQMRLALGGLYAEAGERYPQDAPERARFLAAALREWRAARDLSPVMAAPHARLGVYRDSFEFADPSIRYFERAAKCAPNDADVWYFIGNFHLESGDWPRALADWKHSLALGDSQLERIARKASAKLDPSEMIESLLPADPQLLIRVADQLFPKKEDTAPERQVYLRRAAELLLAAGPFATSEYLRLAELYRESEQYPKAVEFYRRAIDRDSSQASWRVALAQTYREAGELDKAVEELRKLIREDRASKEIRDLLAVVQRELELKE